VLKCAECAESLTDRSAAGHYVPVAVCLPPINMLACTWGSRSMLQYTRIALLIPALVAGSACSNATHSALPKDGSGTMVPAATDAPNRDPSVAAPNSANAPPTESNADPVIAGRAAPPPLDRPGGSIAAGGAAPPPTAAGVGGIGGVGKGGSGGKGGAGVKTGAAGTPVPGNAAGSGGAGGRGAAGGRGGNGAAGERGGGGARARSDD
jgi:hypothetical protein